MDDRSGPDELAIYGLSRQHGVHTAIFNKSYLWTTLADHILRSDEEILKLCSVNLVFLDYTTYGIIKNIQALNPTDTKKTPAPTPAHKKLSKTTCRDSTRKPTKQTEPKPNTTCGKRLRTLSESRQETFGISALVRTLRNNRQTIDYLALNDGLEEDMPDSSKCRKKNSHRQRSKLSATRQVANKYTNPTEPKPLSSTKDSSELQAVPPPPLKKTNDELPGVPTDQTLSELQAVPPPSPKKTNDELPGVPTDQTLSELQAVPPPSPKKTNDELPGVPTDQTLPDLVLEQGGTSYQEVPPGADTTGTEKELDAAATLLSLGTIRDDTLDEDTENSELMPIGGQNAPIDAAPEPIRLDQISVDNAIAGFRQDEEVPDKPDKQKPDSTGVDAENQETNDSKSATDNSPTVKGALKTKMYALKKKAINKQRSFRCSECNEVKRTIKELNIHHRENHNPQICGICNWSFKLASSLTRHMYDHNEPKLNCDQCDYRCRFESELQTHKITHRKNPSYQCMKANYGRWFRRNWDLTLHLQKHDGVRHECDYEGCKFSTETKKQLKEHQKSQSDDCPHKCAACGKGFHYRSGLKRHRDKEHK